MSVELSNARKIGSRIVQTSASDVFAMGRDTCGFEAATKQRPTCVPCAPRVSHYTSRTIHRQFLLFAMSKLFGKVKQKVKKNVGQAVDLLRASPRESRAASPAPPQQSADPNSLTPGGEQQPTTLTATVALAQSSLAPMSIAIESSQLANPAAPIIPSPSPQSTLVAVPVYARPPSPPTVLATTGSAVKGLLAAARDGSDLFLPLKAALVGVVALWDLFDVRHSITFK